LGRGTLGDGLQQSAESEMGNESRSSPESQESDYRFLGESEWNLIFSPYLNRRKNFQNGTKKFVFLQKFSGELFFIR
jgi:hypothetical protein